MTSQDTGRTDVFTPEWVLPRLPGISYVVDNDEFRTVRFVQSPSGRNYGYDPNDFINNRRYYASSTVHPDDVDLSDEQYDKGGRGFFTAARHRILDADGNAAWSIAFARGAMGEDGNCHGVAGIVICVETIPALSGKAEILCALEEDERPVAEPFGDKPPDDWVIQQLPGVLFVCDADPLFRMRFIGGAAAGRLLGYDTRDFLDEPKNFPAWVIHPNDIALVNELSEQLTSRRGDSAVARYRLVRENGETLPILNVIRALPEKDGGQLCGWVIPLQAVPALQGEPGILGWL